MPAQIPLVIDCDPGVDDAVALALAVASPEVDLRAVTTVAGNAPVEVTTANALRLLRAFGRDDVAVATGADRPLVRTSFHGLAPPHGQNGLGDVEVPPAVHGARSQHAVELLADVLRRAEQQSVVIAAIGPLTNIALLVALHPELMDRVDRLVVMCGSRGHGNITPVAEFNVWSDPEAAQRVLAGSGLRVCVVGLDVTRRATLDRSALDALRARSDRGALLADMVRGYKDQAPGGWPMHDALAVASIIDPALVTMCGATIEVDTGLGAGRGQTICTLAGTGPYAPAFGEPPDGRTRAEVAIEVDVPRWRELVLERAAGTGQPPG